MLSRPTVKADIEPVGDLLGGMGATYESLLGRGLRALQEEWHTAELLAQQIDREDTSFLVVEDARSGIVAHAFASAQRSPILFVVRPYVRPAYQRQGLGTRLLAGPFARHPDAELVRLNVVGGNDAALQFHRGQGFAILDEAEDEGGRSLRMERTLA